jgi:ketosteroid isomerase-like protein
MQIPTSDRSEERPKTKLTVSRRTVLGTGVGVLIAGGAAVSQAAGARTWAGLSATKEATILKYYGAWVKKDWGVVDMILADDFTFTSPAPDDHISKSTFKTRCWNTQSPLIKSFDLQRVFGGGDEAFVNYLCGTKSGKFFQNVEYVRFQDGKIAAIQCYFGGAGYPSAANSAHT